MLILHLQSSLLQVMHPYAACREGGSGADAFLTAAAAQARLSDACLEADACFVARTLQVQPTGCCNAGSPHKH